MWILLNADAFAWEVYFAGEVLLIPDVSVLLLFFHYQGDPDVIKCHGNRWAAWAIQINM